MRVKKIKGGKLANLATCGHVRPIPRISTFEFAVLATNGRNRYSPKEISLVPRESIQEVKFPINLPSPEMDIYCKRKHETAHRDDIRLL